MTLSTKILLCIVAIFVTGAVGFIVYKQFEISARQQAIESQIVAQKELADNILRSMSQYTTKKDLEDFAKISNINLDVIKADLEKLNANVVAINVVKSHSNGQTGTDIPSTSTHPGENPNPPTIQDSFGYQANQQILTLNEKFNTLQIPIGDVGFSAWKDKPWTLNIKPREYSSSTVIGTDENQRIYTYNKFSIKVDNKDYEVKISQGEVQQVYPEAKLSWWNPRMFIGMDGGVNIAKVNGEVAPSLNIQLMSYGKYKTQPDISILQIGAGYTLNSQRPGVLITPFSYNIGNLVPLLKNTYIGPSMLINTSGDISVMAGIRVGL